MSLWFGPSSRLGRAAMANCVHQVETWFSILQRKTIRRGVFRSVGSLQSAVHRFIDAWNDHKKPFAWMRTSDEILAKAIPKAISAGLQLAGAGFNR
jgi:hypothetical protein